MVLAAMTILSILVTEFTYIAQVNQQMAYDGLDQIKATYLAKSGFKLSLLRLKIYQQVKALTGANSGLGAAVPKQLLEKIWSFPFMYPIPVLPQMSVADQDRINDFQKKSGLDGNFTAVIESESSKFNLNMILAPYSPKDPSTPSTFDVESSRAALGDYLWQLISQKMESDPDFADEYRDLRRDDLLDSLTAWADSSYEQQGPNRTGMTMKKAPFYSLSELHMIPGVDDAVYDIISPGLTASTTAGVNVNTVQREALRALVPQMLKEELDEFFEFRDSTEKDNRFQDSNAFFDYLENNISAFHKDKEEVKRFRDQLTKKNIRIVTDETTFKITVQAQVKQAVRILEARVTLESPAGTKSQATENMGMTSPSGLKVTFMRII
jgi:general secretion pathway protein K